MPDTPQNVLCVVSSDFGELANALYLLDGAAVQARLMLPPRLYEQNQELAPHDVSIYRNADEVAAALRQGPSQLLLLFSGYLFGVNGLLTVDHLTAILREARTMGIPVATTDPFLGALSHLSGETFVHPRRDALTRHFTDVERVLRAVTHLYLSPMPNRMGSMSFYNPHLVATLEQRAVLFGKLQRTLPDLTEPYWLFVLSLEDYISQSSIFGRSAFDQTIARMTSDAIASGRRVVVLAPRIASESLSTCPIEGATVLDFCDCGTFRALLLTAENVFYWNIFSNSVLARVANDGPAFFFDAGHLARSIPSIVPVAMQSYYANAKLPMLDPAVRLDPVNLRERARMQSETFAAALAAFRSLPSPDETFAALPAGSDVDAV